MPAISGCRNSNELPSTDEPAAIAKSPDVSRPGEAQADRAEQLWRAGNFTQFVDSVLDDAQPSHSPRLKLLQVEALLATGRLQEAEQLASEVSERDRTEDDRQILVRAHKLWVVAQLRQRKPITVCSHVGQGSDADPQLQSIEFWQNALSGQAPYQLSGESGATIELQPITVWSGLKSRELDSIAVTVNGVTMPVAFLDTGAQWTVLTREAATTAGVAIGDSEFPLTGFSSASARPAVVRELTIGSLTLMNVPVLVADTTPLVAAKGQATIGLDVLYHLNTTIDARYGSVTVTDAHADQDNPADQTAHARERKDAGDNEAWEIPIFNFSTASLAQARFDDRSARVMIDTGNAVGTFVSSRWVSETLADARGRKPPPTLWLRKRKLDLPTFELAGQMIEHWPVVDSLPRELEQLDTVDLVMGRDLLHEYRTTIDLANRRLLLSGAPLPPRPATPTRRATAGAEATPLP
jgi:hypothetical protein